MPDSFDPRARSGSNVPPLPDNFNPTPSKTGSDGLGGQGISTASDTPTMFDPRNNFVEGNRNNGPNPRGTGGLSGKDNRPSEGLSKDFNVKP